MAFLDLPVEIVEQILLYAVLGRGVKRGLRLRLVCSESLEAQAVWKDFQADSFKLRSILRPHKTRSLPVTSA